MKNIVIVIAGPTGSGKTGISLELADELDIEIINADSRQVYRYMDIGTAKPTPEEREKVKHYFVDHVNPDRHFDAGQFGEEGRNVIHDIFRRGKTPVVVGGSGLYIKSLIDGLFTGPKQDEIIRQRLDKRIQEEGINSLLSELKSVDPDSAAKLLPANTHRIIRALEVYYLTSKPITLLQKENKINIDFTPVFFAPDWDRKILYDRINRRTLSMIESGLVDEVKKLLSMGYTKELKSFQTVGYKEPVEYLEGKIDHDKMINLIQQYSRNYAKRQLTWFRADQRIEWIDMSIPAFKPAGIILKKIRDQKL